MSWAENQARASFEANNSPFTRQVYVPITKPIGAVEKAYHQHMQRAAQGQQADINLAQRRRTLGY